MLYDEIYVIVQLIIVQFRLLFIYWIFGVIAGSLIATFAADRIYDAVSVVSRSSNKTGAEVKRFFGKSPGKLLEKPLGKLGAITLASLLGAASPICMYGTIPIIISLGKKGVDTCLLIPFMVSSVLINPNLFLFSFALGAPIALLRLAAAVAAGVSAGILTAAFSKGDDILNYETPEYGSSCANGKNRYAFFANFHGTFIKTGPFFLIGLTLTALVDRYFPEEILISLLGSQSRWGVLIAISIGVPLYVCGGGTIPLLRSWLDAGMDPGAAIAFMLAGPATKINNLAALKMILGTRNFIIYVLFSLTFALMAGSLVSWL
ncbi:MAG: permease [Methanosarcinaceae archaeon]|nr:permease [Methanosarcinaceae archaeon]